MASLTSNGMRERGERTGLPPSLYKYEGTLSPRVPIASSQFAFSRLSQPLSKHSQSLFQPHPTLSTMFARAAAFTLLALPLFASATPVRRDSCNTGEMQCCNSVHEVSP